MSKVGFIICLIIAFIVYVFVFYDKPILNVVPLIDDIYSEQ